MAAGAVATGVVDVLITTAFSHIFSPIGLVFAVGLAFAIAWGTFKLRQR